MEEKSLPLVEKSQHTAEILDQMQSKIDAIQTDQQHQVALFQQKIDQLEEFLHQAKEREHSCQSLLQ